MSLSWLLPAALLVTLTGYLVMIGAGMPAGWEWARDSLLGNLAVATAALMLVRHGARHPRDRAATWLLGAGVTCYLAANVNYFLVTVDQPVSFPSPSDLLYLSDPPLLLAGLLVALSRGRRRARLTVLLDGAGAALAGAAVVTRVASPSLRQLYDGSPAESAAWVYLLVGVVMVVAGLGAVALFDHEVGVSSVMLPSGIVLLGAGNVVYARELLAHSYQSGHWLDAVWVVGLALLAWGGTHPEHRRPTAVEGRPLVVASASCVTAVIVLSGTVALSQRPLPGILAVLALTICSVRFGLAFEQLRELAVVREQALTDELTGVANRRAIYAELDRLLSRDGLGHPPLGFTLVLVDLDHFKEVNDLFGHAVGDALLREVVSRFSAALREAGTDHVQGRLGGDEFALVLRGVEDTASALEAGHVLAASLERPAVIAGAVVHPQASFGLSIAPLHGEERADLMFAADAAMYAAKSAAEPVRLHVPSVGGGHRRRPEVGEELFDALASDQLVVEYQPVRSIDGPVVGCEALVRWNHSTRGRLVPEEFLPAAERYRLGPAVTERVLDLALADVARWQAGGDGRGCSVNVSASDIADVRLLRTVTHTLARHGVPPGLLTVEVPEAGLAVDPEASREVMRQLDELGVLLAIDHYGTGGTSLAHLLRLPVDLLKLDGSFCARVTTDHRAGVVVGSMLDLADGLGLQMVVQGVEDVETLEELRRLGCQLVQGPQLGRPVSAQAFAELWGR